MQPHVAPQNHLFNSLKVLLEEQFHMSLAVTDVRDGRT